MDAEYFHHFLVSVNDGCRVFFHLGNTVAFCRANRSVPEVGDEHLKDFVRGNRCAAVSREAMRFIVQTLARLEEDRCFCPTGHRYPGMGSCGQDNLLGRPHSRVSPLPVVPMHLE